MSSPLFAVLPGGIDDPAAPSGGNRYDREVLRRLAAGVSTPSNPGSTPFSVREEPVPGSWPRPRLAEQTGLSRFLGGLPDGSLVLIDGLVACGVPGLLQPHAGRLHLAVLVHLPLSDETGLSDAEAADLRSLERRTLRLASAVIATSTQAARHVEEMHGLTGVHVAAPGVDPAPLTEPSPGGGRLLNVASLRHRKGQDVLLAALAKLTDLDWTCTFAGPGPIPASPLPGVRFAGPLTGAALDAAYAEADLFVLPSRAETYGMVVTEALARGLPVVASDIGGVPEALGSVDAARPGRLLPPGDPDALAETLREWLTDPALRQRWRDRARARRENLTGWDDTAARIADILERLSLHRDDSPVDDHRSRQ
ncbi:glycosyltransferase family 4 protein [Actinoplanes sp. GCM10030250]|uniref:glycosyltransferase family 4 protein n=1 Tax=Actinoplanes sp. GCM10030250 TaxID=3273376 RepID=UPI003613FF85